jgi:cytochrome c556
MRKILWIGMALAVVLSVGILAVTSPAEEPKKDKDGTQALMQRKLKESQKALEGIALNDYNKISASADELIDISKTAEWKVLKDPQYEVFSNEFRRRVDQMRTAAKEKNLDGATLAYMEVTMSCVRCHKHVREVRRTQLDPVDAGRALGE